MMSIALDSYHHRLSTMSPSRESMTCTSTKGLLNAPGQNNCFLNSAVQVLWHLDIFRRSFRDLSGHACMVESCIFCALKELFSQLQFSNETALPPDALRRALAESFYDQQRFQLGFMDDAAECFENMLLRIHMHIAKGEAEDMCNARHCIPHQKFAMTLVEQSVCSACGASSEPLPFTQMVHYVSASALTAQAHQVISGSVQVPVDLFGKLLRRAGGMGDIRDCPSTCGAKIQIRRSLMNRPEIVSVGIVWDSERPTLEHIMDVFAAIGTTLRLADVFYSVVDNKWADTTLHNLVGVVTYYGKHYSTFFFHSKLRVWIYFDDATVREVGPRWDQVVDKCRRGRYQPLLLLYAVPNGTPVNTENAPKQVTSFYNEKILKTTNALMRRSVTPSPEKPSVGNTRRAITPNPDGSFSQKPPVPCSYNEYQNLSIIQDKIRANSQLDGTDTVDGDISREPEYISRKAIENVMYLQQHAKPQVHRTLSNGSSSGMEGICVPEHLNVPRRRDSGNWSGDRNSASSSSSTTMENPYSYLVGKLPHTNGGSVPSSPTRVKSDSSSGGSGVYDAGYDSYSLSSNDSSAMATVQHLMKQGHLAKIPEDYGNSPNQQFGLSCDVLCDEADELLGKSRQLEDEHDLVLALALCNAAATKARAAMNAPYNNPQTLTLARMKHNTCIMRARSLHRRITQTQNPSAKESHPEIRHTREGSSGSGRHSRQSSRDKGQHSRQNSKELLVVPPAQEKPTVQTKNIEIYATLPKKKGLLKSKAIDFDEDEDYILYDKPPARESRGLLSRMKIKDESKVKEKRSRSEDRNKISRDFSLAPSNLFSSAKDKDTLKRETSVNDNEDKKEKDKSGKKQHKIRRKLLMGGLIRRKNRSMPDLTKENEESKVKNPPVSSVDDSNVGVKNSDNNVSSMCGYLSEGHLDFSASTANPNLERSRLMRKSFHGNAGKVLTVVAKVPPPPPLRTTSQLSNKQNEDEIYEVGEELANSQYKRNMAESHAFQHTVMNSPLTTVESNYQNVNHYIHQGNQFLPFNTVITQADVHQEQSPVKYLCPRNQSNGNPNTFDDVDEVDCVRPSSIPHQLDLPPYPSPSGSVIHSRQGSAEFPLPPPPLDLTVLEELLPNSHGISPPPPPPESLLAQPQFKRLEILPSTNMQRQNIEPSALDDTWLRELQARQEAIRVKKGHLEMPMQASNAHKLGEGRKVSVDSLKAEQSKITSVKDLASKFENIQPNSIVLQNLSVTKPYNILPHTSRSSPTMQNDIYISQHSSATLVNSDVLSKKRDDQDVSPIQIAAEISEVEKLNAVVHNTLNFHQSYQKEGMKQGRPLKKKSVSFCDQVILVATADEQEEDTYIPNPILERVLRNAFTKSDDGTQMDVGSEENCNTHLLQNTINDSIYVRRNSLENLLSANINPINNVQRCTEYMNYPSNQIDVNTVQQQLQRPLACSDHFKVQSYNHQGLSDPTQSLYGSEQECRRINEPCENYYVSRNTHISSSNQVRQSPIPAQQQLLSGNCQNIQAYPFPQHPYSHNPQLLYSPPPTTAPHQQMINNPYTYQNRSQCYQKIPSYPSYKQTSLTGENGPMQTVYHKISNDESNKMYLPYQRIPNHQTNGEILPYQNGQHVDRNYSPYHMVTNANQSTIERNRINEDLIHRQSPSYHASPYQHVIPSKQYLQKKTVSFEPGTKGGTESPTPKAVVTPIIVNPINNKNNAGIKTKCNLCRKKYVSASNSYCTDCEFYMSRFKPKS